jgi:hypothetical protein
LALNAWLRSDAGPEQAAAHSGGILVMDCAVAIIGFGVTCLILWIPRMWRGTLKETNQLSKAIQGKLDSPTDDKNSGAGI